MHRQGMGRDGDNIKTAAAPGGARIDAALKAALAFMPVKAAAEMIADLTGGSRKTLYARALELKDGD